MTIKVGNIYYDKLKSMKCVASSINASSALKDSVISLIYRNGSIQNLPNQFFETAELILVDDSFKSWEDAVKSQAFQSNYVQYDEKEMIGCLCWFWNEDSEDKTIGILTEITDDKQYYSQYSFGTYIHCQPISPNEVKFYKG